MPDRPIPVDPDIDLHVPAERTELRPHAWPVLSAIAAGGALGASARYGISVALPHPPGAFAWPIFLANVSGCLLIGVLMTSLAEAPGAPRLLRPFLGVGVLGGYTTFSTYVLDTHRTLASGAAGTALLYLFGTLAGALLAVWAGSALTAAVLARREPAGRAETGAGR